MDIDKNCNNCKHEDKRYNEKPCLYCKQCGEQRDLWEPKEKSKMSKNYVKEFMEDNKLEINIEFPVKSHDGDVYMFHFIDDFNLVDHNKNVRIESLIDLLTRISKIVPLPFSSQNLPKQNEKIWYVTPKEVVCFSFDSFVGISYALVASGNAFRTKEEAEANAPRIRKEQGMTKS